MGCSTGMLNVVVRPRFLISIILCVVASFFTAKSFGGLPNGEFTHQLRQCEGTLRPDNCVLTEEGVAIKRKGPGTYYVYARTRTGSIYHSCEYTAIAKARGETLISGTESSCKVTISFKNGEAFLSSEGSTCRDFCSAQASLHASHLKRRTRHVNNAPVVVSPTQ